MKDIEQVIFHVAEALRAPVLILALIALAVTLIELGAFFVELLRRRRRDYVRLETAALEARAALERGDEPAAKAALRPVAWSTAMARALAFMVDQWGRAQVGDRLAKGLADFDFRSLRRLERTRLLVRAGPALGLMGTLIPLSPALEGLAKGNTAKLSENLRIAFSVTVLGLLIGAVAFAISLVRDRLYGQDLSDLEFVAATLSPESELDSGGGGARPAGRRAVAAGVPPTASAAAAPPPPASAAAAPPPPASAAAAPPPSASAAAVGNKPPPPTDAKPLGADLPPPGGAPAAPAAPAPAPPAPAPAAPGGDAGAPAPGAPVPGAAAPGNAQPAAIPPPPADRPTQASSQQPDGDPQGAPARAPENR